MVFNLGNVQPNNRQLQKKAGKATTILIASGCGNTMWGALPNGAHQGLHSKPLDAAIGQVKKYTHVYLRTHDWTPGVKSIFCMPGRSYQWACH
jgi:hypothetical protein